MKVNSNKKDTIVDMAINVVVASFSLVNKSVAIVKLMSENISVNPGRIRSLRGVPNCSSPLGWE